jgi:hypothetical protein
VRAVDEQALLQRFGNVRSAFDVQINAQHQAFAANFADEIEFRGQLFQARLKFGAARANVGEQLFPLDGVEKRQARGARQRSTAKRRAVQAGENAAANSSRARNAPSGSPPASGFATMTMSGRPSRRW